MSRNWSRWIRQSHRWVSIAFTVAVIANFVALGLGQEQPPPWVTYSPLLPLALLLFSGLYLFVLPYASRWRGGRSTGRAAEPPARDAQGGRNPAQPLDRITSRTP